MATACGGHHRYRLPLAPVRAGVPSRCSARSSLLVSAMSSLGRVLRRPELPRSPCRIATPVPVEKLTREGEGFRIGSKNVRSGTHTDDDSGCGADDVIDA